MNLKKLKIMSKTKTLWQELEEQDRIRLQNKRLTLYRWYGEMTNKQMLDSGWDDLDNEE